MKKTIEVLEIIAKETKPLSFPSPTEMGKYVVLKHAIEVLKRVEDTEAMVKALMFLPSNIVQTIMLGATLEHLVQAIQDYLKGEK